MRMSGVCENDIRPFLRPAHCCAQQPAMRERFACGMKLSFQQRDAQSIDRV